MARKKRVSFSPEFKREAVRLLLQGDKETAQLARELGVARNKLYLWKDEVEKHGDNAFPGPGNRKRSTTAKVSTSELEAEVKRLREENEILKKAGGYRHLPHDSNRLVTVLHASRL